MNWKSETKKLCLIYSEDFIEELQTQKWGGLGSIVYRLVKLDSSSYQPTQLGRAVRKKLRC